MALDSNQDLWQVLVGHSALRDHNVIEQEVKSYFPQLKRGVAYYQKPSSEAEKRLKASNKVKGKKLTLVLDISGHLQLDQEQSFVLFENFLISAHHGPLTDVRGKVESERGRREVVRDVTKFYYSERLHLQRCLKHLLGFWQDPNHPYRDIYMVCVGELTEDETSLIKALWASYQECVEAEIPSAMCSSEEEASWLLQNLMEQVEILETILLYYKDFVHQPTDLLATAKLIQDCGFGLRQASKVHLVAGADTLLTHLTHLSSLILVESLDLDLVCRHLGSSSSLSAEHHLLQSNSSSTFKELEDLVLEWGSLQCHAPILLAWALLKFVQQQHTALEATRLLGNRALQADVFGYLSSLLQSSFFKRERPVAGVARSVVHTLLSVAVTAFSEDSLGDTEVLVAIATHTFTHPPLRLELWEKGLSSGVGLLLSSSLTHFPLHLTPLTSLLRTLSSDVVSAGNVFKLLQEMHHFTEPFSLDTLGGWVDLGEEEEEEEEEEEREERSILVLTKSRSFYSEEAGWLGCHGISIPAGVRGEVWRGRSGDVISWRLPAYSAWTLCALEAVRLLGIGTDPSSSPVVARVTEVANLLSQMLTSDWSLSAYVQPITSQYFPILQKFSPLPNPPTELLAACLSCITVMATNNTAHTWEVLGRTGFLPYIGSSFASVEEVQVAPGHYGHLLNAVERPQGTYPVSMAMLDLLATTCLPSRGSPTNEQLACLVYVMREIFATCHKWRYRHGTDRDDLFHRLLEMVHGTLNRHRETPNFMGSFLTHFLLSSPGGTAVLQPLSLGVDAVNWLYSSGLCTASISAHVECLKLSLSIVDFLLQSKCHGSTLLEQTLATRSPHIISTIASYIYHRGDPQIPQGATFLLTRLCQMAPLSVFACLGADAVVKRDTFVARLSSYVESVDLKCAILDLVLESVTSQPGVMELFLCVRSTTHSQKGEPQYSIEPSSCLHTVLNIINPDKQGPSFPTSLLPPTLSLLRALWKGRHDAILHALQREKDFWRNLTTPLFSELDLGEVQGEREKEAAEELTIASHVMHIVAMEMYYVFQGKLDKSLQAVLQEAQSTGCVKAWMQCLKYPFHCDAMSDGQQQLSPALLEAQHQYVLGCKTLLLVANTHQPSLFHLSECETQTATISSLLTAVESQVSAPVSKATVAIATELSLLLMILIQHWEKSLPTSAAMIVQFVPILHHVTRLDPAHSSPLTLHLYASLLNLLRTARQNRECVEQRYLMGVVPYLSDTLLNHHLFHSLGFNRRPEIVVTYLLAEMVGGVSDWSPWLQTFRNHSIVPMLIKLVDDKLKLKSDESFIEAILSMFLAMATTGAGAEALLVNGVGHTLSLPLGSALDTKLNPAPLAIQPPGGSLKPRPPTGWSRVWHCSLRLVALLGSALSHRALPHLLDFTGVHQERIVMSLDILEAIQSLQSLESTRSSAYFVQQMSHYRQHCQFSVPTFHRCAIERTVQLTGCVAAVLSKRATLKHIVKTMHASGGLPTSYGPPAVRGRVQMLPGSADESWVTSSAAFTELQDGLVSTLMSCLVTLKNYSPPLKDVVMETGYLDQTEYVPLFLPSLTPPTVDQTTPPTLGTLTTCLSVGLDLLKKLEPHRVGTPSKSPGRSPSHPRSQAQLQKRADLLCLLEHAVLLVLGQASWHLSSSQLPTHDKQVLRKELASEMDSFSHGLLRNFSRKGAPSPSSSSFRSSSTAPASLLHDSSSGKTSSLVFNESCEQGIFRLADNFAKHYLRY